MRTFLQSKAGAQFYSGMPFTIAIHKDYWEYVIKLKRGYVVINAFLTKGHTISLYASWGDYFKSIQHNAAATTILENIRTECPTFYKLFTEDGEFYNSALPDGSTGICKEVALPDTPTIKMMTDDNVIEAVEAVMHYSGKLYNEIYDKCPLKDWVNRLEEI